MELLGSDYDGRSLSNINSVYHTYRVAVDGTVIIVIISYHDQILGQWGSSNFVAVANNHFTISFISGQFSEINMPATCYGYNEIELKRNYGYQSR